MDHLSGYNLRNSRFLESQPAVTDDVETAKAKYLVRLTDYLDWVIEECGEKQEVRSGSKLIGLAGNLKAALVADPTNPIHIPLL